MYTILKKPIVTEKTANLEMLNNTYVFEVSGSATKVDVKKAILDIYGVQVASVNMVSTREKFKYGKKRNMQVRRRASKKAYVTLRDATAKLDAPIVK
ncbi:MAG: 50S ribosomal protein L23 [Candidatus Peribacteria bacterium]|nr:MAG: 50S ribosomal protein L23 [Candidatus Peribacteria bacterium]